MRRLTPLAVPLLAAAALAAAAQPAAADSIAYVKEGNVWLATPDGARHHQVTRDGDYGYVSQADDGTLIALHGRNIRRLNRADGAVTAEFATPVSATPAGAAFEFSGPLDPVVSPDGTRIAYGYNARYTRYDPYCGRPGGCSEGKLIVGTGYSRADRQTNWDEPGFRQHSGWQWPSWMDDQRVLITDPAEVLNLQFYVDQVGDDAHGLAWFRDDTHNPDSRDAEATRQGTGVAAVEGFPGSEKTIHVWKTTGPPPAEPAHCMYVGGEAGGPALGAPSWSPDGSSLAFEEGGAIAVLPGIDLAGCDAGRTGAGRIVAAAGSSPDWGPADVPPAPPVVDPPPGGGARRGGGDGAGRAGGRGGRAGGGADGRGRPARLAVTLPKRLGLRAMLRRGLPLTVATGSAGRVTAIVRARGRRVGAAAAKTSSGRARLRVRFTRSAAKTLRARRSLRLSIAFAFAPSRAGPAGRRTVTLVVPR